MTDEFFYSTFGMQNYMIIPMLLGRDAILSEVNKLSDWKEQRYRELIKEKLVPSVGAKSLLSDLKSKDQCLIFASAQGVPRTARALLRVCPFRELLLLVVCVPVPKLPLFPAAPAVSRTRL